MHTYSTDGSRGAALGLLATLSVIVAIVLNAIFEKFHLGPPWLLSAPSVAAAFGLLYRLLDTIAWRWPVLRAVGLIDVPNVEGVYEGELNLFV